MFCSVVNRFLKFYLIFANFNTYLTKLDFKSKYGILTYKRTKNSYGEFSKFNPQSENFEG